MQRYDEFAKGNTLPRFYGLIVLIWHVHIRSYNVRVLKLTKPGNVTLYIKGVKNIY